MTYLPKLGLDSISIYFILLLLLLKSIRCLTFTIHALAWFALKSQLLHQLNYIFHCLQLNWFFTSLCYFTLLGQITSIHFTPLHSNWTQLFLLHFTIHSYTSRCCIWYLFILLLICSHKSCSGCSCSEGKHQFPFKIAEERGIQDNNPYQMSQDHTT